MTITAEKKEYVVKVQEVHPFWHIYVPEIDYSTQAERIEQVEGMARDLIAAITEEESDSFTLYVVFESLDPLA